MRFKTDFVRCKDFGEIMHGVSYTPNDLRDADDGVLILRACNIQDSVITYDDNVYVDVKCVDPVKRLRKNDILICGTNGSLRLVGKSAIVPSDDCGAFGSFMLRLRVKGNAQFVQYQLCALTDRYRGLFSTVTINQLTATQLSTMRFWWPNKAMQRHMVAYLDEKTAAIDARIAVLEKKIAAYRRLRASIINHTVTCGFDSNVRMKDSGVDWIGKVPKGWAIKRVKDDYFLKGRIGWQGLKANEFIDEGPWLITGTDFNNGKIDWSRCYHISEERYRLDLDLQIHEGDLLVTKDGTVGKLAYIDHVPGLCSLNSHLLLMRPVKRGIDNRFMYWVLSSNVFRHYIEYESNGSTMQSLSQEAVSRFSYSAPEIEEQLRIARYLDGECLKIDRKVELVAKEIELYRKLKRSLINEVVTGKRKVA